MVLEEEEEEEEGVAPPVSASCWLLLLQQLAAPPLDCCVFLHLVKVRGRLAVGLAAVMENQKTNNGREGDSKGQQQIQ